MTTLALSHFFNRAPAFLYRLNQRLTAFIDGIDEARTLAHRFQTLSQMTDQQLAARGLTREQIPQAVIDPRVRV